MCKHIIPWNKHVTQTQATHNHSCPHAHKRPHTHTNTHMRSHAHSDTPTTTHTQIYCSHTRKETRTWGQIWNPLLINKTHELCLSILPYNNSYYFLEGLSLSARFQKALQKRSLLKGHAGETVFTYQTRGKRWLKTCWQANTHCRLERMNW